MPRFFPILTCMSFWASLSCAACGDFSIRSRTYWPISTLVYSRTVTRQATANNISPATRNRGLARRASNVLEGSKKMPVKVSAVDISTPVADVFGSLIDFLLRKITGEKASVNGRYIRLKDNLGFTTDYADIQINLCNLWMVLPDPNQEHECTRRDGLARLPSTPDRYAHTCLLYTSPSPRDS